MDDLRHETASPVKILIAEKRGDVRRSLRELLQTYKDVCVLDAVRSSEAALAIVEALQPDVVLLGCPMVAKPGFSVVDEIKRRRPQSRVVVMGMSGCRESLARAAGADDYVVKGCSAEQLVEAVRRSGSIS